MAERDKVRQSSCTEFRKKHQMKKEIQGWMDRDEGSKGKKERGIKTEKYSGLWGGPEERERERKKELEINYPGQCCTHNMLFSLIASIQFS